MSYKNWKKLLLWDRKNSKVDCQLPRATKMAEIIDSDTVPSLLLPCTSCNRTFRPEALSKHTKVCEKSLMRKRKKFDSLKQRIQGTEIAQFLPSVGKSGIKSPIVRIEPQSKWKEKELGGGEDRYNIGRKVPSNRQIPFIKTTKAQDHEQCPYCDRYFGPKAFDRHAEWCKEQSTRMKTKSQTCLEAKERLQARTKYRAPLGKTQRSLTKEHYSPMRSHHDVNIHKTDSGNQVRKVQESNEKQTVSLTRSQSQRSPMKFSSTLQAPQLSRSLSVKSDNRPEASRENTIQPEDEESTNKTPTPSRPKVINRGNVSEKRDLDKYDPFVSAELQMLELFSEENKGINKRTASKREEVEGEGNDNGRKILPVLNTSPVVIQSSPLSAFAKFSPISPDCSPPLLPPSLSESSPLHFTPPIQSTPPRRGSDASSSNYSASSLISLDSIDYNRNMGRNQLFQRSQSAMVDSSRPGGRHPLKTKPNMEEMLFGPSGGGVVGPLNGNQLERIPVSRDDVETCEAELIASMLEFEEMLNSKLPQSDGEIHPSSPPFPPTTKNNNPSSSPSPTHKSPFTVSTTPSKLPNPHNQKSISPTSIINNNIDDSELQRRAAITIGQCVDSAYSSLTRKTPPFESGGGGVDSTLVENNEPSRFCHECGSRYPIPVAKFCCNCGIKRITI